MYPASGRSDGLVSQMANNLTARCATFRNWRSRFCRNGDYRANPHSRRARQVHHQLKTINAVVDQRTFRLEVTQQRAEVARRGKLGGQAISAWCGAFVEGPPTGLSRAMTGNLTLAGAQHPAEVTTAVAKAICAQGYGRRARRNHRVEGNHQHGGRKPAQQVRCWVTRVAREVDAKANLGGQAKCQHRQHLEGSDQYINSVASNLTSQVRDMW